MSKVHRSVVASLLLCIVGTAGAGWDYSWTASSGLRLDETTPAFSRTGYQTTVPGDDNYTGIVTDSVTGLDALTLVQGSSNGRYELTTGFGAGTAQDTIRMEFDLRLLDTATSEEQIRYLIYRPTQTAGQYTRVEFYFGRDSIIYRNGSDKVTIAANLGTDWHDMAITFDVAGGAGALYIDDITTPFITSTAQVGTGSYNEIYIGDGSSSVIEGQVNMSYLQWTNSIPEPTTIGVIALGGIALLRKRSRQTRYSPARK